MAATIGKIHIIIYYDCNGKVQAVGAEAMREGIYEQTEDGQWVKAEWCAVYLCHSQRQNPDNNNVCLMSAGSNLSIRAFNQSLSRPGSVGKTPRSGPGVHSTSHRLMATGIFDTPPSTSRNGHFNVDEQPAMSANTS
jgi:hypothetical protein